MKRLVLLLCLPAAVALAQVVEVSPNAFGNQTLVFEPWVKPDTFTVESLSDGGFVIQACARPLLQGSGPMPGIPCQSGVWTVTDGGLYTSTDTLARELAAQLNAAQGFPVVDGGSP